MPCAVIWFLTMIPVLSFRIINVNDLLLVIVPDPGFNFTSTIVILLSWLYILLNFTPTKGNMLPCDLSCLYKLYLQTFKTRHNFKNKIDKTVLFLAFISSLFRKSIIQHNLKHDDILKLKSVGVTNFHCWQWLLGCNLACWIPEIRSTPGWFQWPKLPWLFASHNFCPTLLLPSPCKVLIGVSQPL